MQTLTWWANCRSRSDESFADSHRPQSDVRQNVNRRRASTLHRIGKEHKSGGNEYSSTGRDDEPFGHQGHLGFVAHLYYYYSRNCRVVYNSPHPRRLSPPAACRPAVLAVLIDFYVSAGDGLDQALSKAVIGVAAQRSAGGIDRGETRIMVVAERGNVLSSGSLDAETETGHPAIGSVVDGLRVVTSPTLSVSGLVLHPIITL